MNKKLFLILTLFVCTLVYAADTTLTFVGTGATAGSGDRSWTNATNITADDTSYAQCSNLDEDQSTNNLQGTMGANNFSIPSGSTIDGIEVKVYADAGSGDEVYFTDARLLIGGVLTGADKSTSNLISTSWELFTWGGPTDTWSLVSPTAEQMNATDFGASVVATEDGRGDNAIVYVDYMQIVVYYTEAGGSQNVVRSIL